MTAEIASLDRVRLAVESLRRDGISPTAHRAIERIGGGSKSTVLSHLKSLRDLPIVPCDIPGTVLELARPALSEAYRAGRTAEADAVRAATERLSGALRDQDDQITELGERNEVLETHNAFLGEKLARADDEIKALADKLEESRSEVDDLRKQVGSIQTKAEGDLEASLTRVADLLEKASIAKPPQTGRQTISLPGSKSPSRR